MRLLKVTESYNTIYLQFLVQHMTNLRHTQFKIAIPGGAHDKLKTHTFGIPVKAQEPAR